VQRRATTEPFAVLAAVLEDRLAILRGQILADGWAMTRHDVVAHSQGGVLIRMLCSRNPNGHVALPFRNFDNLNRGRFHRVVTIGSPHNGSRLVSYMERLENLRQAASPGSPPAVPTFLAAPSPRPLRPGGRPM
jgi:triacylglycerol esterase/lipase EstA (alpha/beta hydrolase family)